MVTWVEAVQPLAAVQHEDGSGAEQKADDAGADGADELHHLVAVGVVPEPRSQSRESIGSLLLKAGQRLTGLRAHALCAADGHA